MMTRHNPMRTLVNPGAYSVVDLADLANVARQLGLTDLAGLLESGTEMAVQLAAAINDAVGDGEEQEEAPRVAEVPKATPKVSGELSDYEGWTMLADLVPQALSDQPKELQDALIAAFRAEAAKAR